MSYSSKIHKISNIIYAPWCYGQTKPGVQFGASYIQQFVDEMQLSLRPNSKTIVVEENDIKNNEEYHQKLYQARIESMNNTLVVGGDHSIAIGSLLGTLHSIKHMDSSDNELGVIWIDAHADINTLRSSQSGNVHGMPLAFVTGIDESWQWVNETKLRLEFEHLYYWGIRDLDNFEIDIIDNYGIKVISDKEEAMHIIDSYKYIHTSLDIDGLDPRYASTRADHGLELKDVLDYIYYLKFQSKSLGFDLVEYNPELGSLEEKYITGQTVKSLLNAIL